MRKSFVFRLYPNRNQERELGIVLESHRRLYNACLEQRILAWREDHVPVTYYDQSSWFKNQRFVNPWFVRTNFSSAQGTMRRLDRAFRAFFRRVKAGQKPGHPRFKAKDRFNSIEFPAYGNGVRLAEGRLRVQHVGKIKCKVHRPVEGTVKTVRIKRETNKWYVILSCDLGEIAVTPSTNPPIGVDVGLTSFLTTSDGEKKPNPRYLKKELPAIRRASRSVSRKTKGSSNRRKAVKKLRRLHTRVKHLRHDHRHKTALDLVRRFGVIAVENLSIKSMLKNRWMARAIADAAWGGFLATLEQKAESAGARMVKVNARGTSQDCSGCGCEVPKKLSVRTHSCPHCGLVLDRDCNAARNILARALARTGPAGVNGQTSAVA